MIHEGHEGHEEKFKLIFLFVLFVSFVDHSYQTNPVPRSPRVRVRISTTTATAIISSDTAMAASILPMLSSRKTVVGSTSVRNRVAPEKIRIGPNSPSDLAHD